MKRLKIAGAAENRSSFPRKREPSRNWRMPSGFPR